MYPLLTFLQSWAIQQVSGNQNPNLDKGIHLRSLLESAGAQVIMSRVQNRTIDDRPLSAIAEEANANQVDFYDFYTQ
jgi:hypothetical protein